MYDWNYPADQAAQSDLHQFQLDEGDNDSARDSRTGKKKRLWRQRWPDGFRDEALVRLLE